MVQIEGAASERKGKTFSHNKKQSLRIDMTPMVDLGFLLITFFVFTTTLSEPKAADLFMPKESNDSLNLPESLALTLLLGAGNRVFYYAGDFNEAVRANMIYETSYSTYEGVGKAIRQKQNEIETSKKFPEGKKGMMLLVKPPATRTIKM